MIDKWLAKSNPEETIIQHLKKTAIVTKVLLNNSVFSNVKSFISINFNITEEESAKLILYITSLHDVGKCHPIFQEKIMANTESCKSFFDENPNYKYSNSAIDAKFRHEKESANILNSYWKTNNYFDRTIRNSFARAIELHHPGKEGDVYHDSDSIALWESEQNAIIKELEDWIQPITNITIKSITKFDACMELVMGMIIISDWIASNANLITTTLDEYEELIKVFIDKLGLRDEHLPKSDSFSTLWPFIKRETMRPVQCGIEEIFTKEEMPLCTIIEAPMGEGKTESGLFAAMQMAKYWNKSGFYFALPTAATSNQMVLRMNNLLGMHGLDKSRLIHSTAWLQEDDDNFISNEIEAEAAKWLISSKKALLSPIAVGTVDQAMLSAMKVKYGVLRLLGLFNKVLVIDEVHAYDAYMSTILKGLLTWCKELNIPVVLLSATLPLDKKQELMSVYGTKETYSNAYPLITSAYADSRIEEVKIGSTYMHGETFIETLPILNKAKEIAKVVIDKNSYYGGCGCVIVNTINEAQKVYKEIKTLNPTVDVHLFHSRFTVGRRQEIERDECLKLYGSDTSYRPESSILVATQVVEQSLDIDFDWMISSIAPIDLLLQRLGRLHRHSEISRPVNVIKPILSVLIPDKGKYGSTERIYYPLLLDRTLDIVKDIKSINIPTDIPLLVDKVYQNITVTPDEMQKFLNRAFDIDLKQSIGQQFELPAPKEKKFSLDSPHTLSEDEDGMIARTRLGEESTTIAILPEHLYKEVKTLIEQKKYIPKSLAKEVFYYSTKSDKKKVSNFIGQPDTMGDPMIEGKGLLFGMNIWNAHTNDITPIKSAMCSCKVGNLIVDREMGFIIQTI